MAVNYLISCDAKFGFEKQQQHMNVTCAVCTKRAKGLTY